MNGEDKNRAKTSGFVPITIKKDIASESQTIDQSDYIIIDDDPVIHTTWRLAGKISGKKIQSYTNIDLFYKDIDRLNKRTPLYIDSNLGKGIKGEQVAKEIKNCGFERIYLATGYRKDDFGVMPWIEAVVDKRPPFVRE